LMCFTRDRPGRFSTGLSKGRTSTPSSIIMRWWTGRVLKASVALCLLAWGLLGFSCASSTWLLVLFLATDVIFIILECIYGAFAGFHPSDFSIGQDWGYAETFQYVKEFGILVLFSLFFLRHPYVISLGWLVLFLYILMDDSLQIHESLAKSISQYFDLSLESEFRARAIRVFSQHTVSAFFGSLILSLLSIGYYYAPSPLRRMSWHLFGLFILLVLFGVFLDTVHELIGLSVPSMFRIGYVVEEAGEMVTISVIAWYVHRLTTNSHLTLSGGHHIAESES
jgi:hypothetical protein